MGEEETGKPNSSTEEQKAGCYIYGDQEEEERKYDTG
jgi:hypothetical protein